MKTILWMLPIALVLSGCFGLDEMKETTQEMKQEVIKTNEEVKKTNEGMERLRVETSDHMLDLIYKQSTVGLLAVMNEEGMSNIGVSAAQKYLQILKVDELRKALALVYPVEEKWIKQGLPNVTWVGTPAEDVDISVEVPLDHDPMSEKFHRLYKRAAYQTLRDLKAKARTLTELSAEEFEDLQKKAERAVIVAPKVWGARSFEAKTGLESAAELAVIVDLVRDVVSSYQLPEEAADLAEIAIDAL